MEKLKPNTFKPGKVSLAAILLASMVILMGAAAIAPALEPISRAFPNQSAFMISLVITLPALASALTGFGMGMLADRWGRARTFVLSLFIFTIAGVFGYFTDSFWLMLGGRFVLGIGIAGISLTASALIGAYYFGQDRAKVVGYQSAAIGIGTLFLESLGGSLADIGWNFPFLVYLIGVPIILLALVGIREPTPIVSAAGTTAEPEIPNRQHRIRLCYLMVALEMFMMFAVPVNFSYYISEIGENYLVCGILLGVMGVCQAICSILYAKTANKLSEMDAYAYAFLCMGAGMLCLGLGNLAAVAVSMVLIGVSLGLLMPTVIGSLAHLSGPCDAGRIMGGYSVALNLATFISAIIFTALIIPAIGSYQWTFIGVGVVAVVLFAISKASAVISRLHKPKPQIEHTLVKKTPLMDFSVRMYGSILVATDGSDSCRYAVESAVNTAKKNGAHLTALYVFDPEVFFTAGNEFSAANGNEYAKEASADALAQVSALSARNGVPLDTKVLTGHAADVIIDESQHYDLVICGSLGRTNIKRVLIGSVAEKVARMAYCPVLICRKYQRS